MKVVVPGDFHARLHALKIVTGLTIGELVTGALDYYFAVNLDQSKEDTALRKESEGDKEEKDARDDP